VREQALARRRCWYFYAVGFRVTTSRTDLGAHKHPHIGGGAAPVQGSATAAEASPLANLVLRTACGDVAMKGAAGACRFHGGTRGSEPNRDVL